MLQGGTSYTFRVTVIPENGGDEDKIESSVVVNIASKGVEAKVTSKSLTFGTETPIRLDGSLSVDHDNLPGDLLV